MTKILIYTYVYKILWEQLLAAYVMADVYIYYRWKLSNLLKAAMKNYNKP